MERDPSDFAQRRASRYVIRTIRACLTRQPRIKTCRARPPSGGDGDGGLDEVAAESGPAINPIEQFSLSDLLPITIGGHHAITADGHAITLGGYAPSERRDPQCALSMSTREDSQITGT